MGWGEDILSALKRGEFDGNAANVSAYLASLHSDPSPIAVKQSCSLAHIFLYTYTMDFEKLPHSEVSPAIKAAQECATVIKTRSTNPKVIESAEKLLYHILNKAIKKEFLSESLGLSKILRDFLLLHNQNDESVQVIVKSSYSVLWNAAVKEERDPNADPNLCIRLRFRALNFFLFSDKAIEKGREVVPWTVDHYGHDLAKRKMDGKSLQKRCDLMCKLVAELSEVIDMRANALKGKCEKLVMFHVLQFEMHVHLLAFNLTYNPNQRKCITDDGRTSDIINQFQGYISRTSLLPDIPLLLIELMNIGIHLSFFAGDVDSDKKRPFTESELVLSMERSSSILSSPDLQKSLSLPAIYMLHSAIQFCLKLPDDGAATGGTAPKITVRNMPEKALMCLIELHKNAEKFFVIGSKFAAKSKERKLVLGLESARCKVLQYQLTHVLGLLDGLKDGSSVKIPDTITRAKGDLCELDKLTSRDACGKKLDELHSLASLVLKFGRFCVARGMHREAEYFLKSSIAKFTLWKREIPEEKSATVCIWNKWKLLAESQQKAGMLESALSTIAEGLCAEPENLRSACELWVRVKIEIVKSEQSSPNTGSLWHSIKGNAPALRAEDVLKNELTLYKKSLSRPRYHELIYVVIEELLAIKTLDPVSRALTLLDKTQLLWLSRREDEITPSEYCQRAIVLLEGAKADEKTSQASLDDLTARAYLWKHLVSSIDPLETHDVMTKRTSAAKKVETNIEAVDVQEDNEIYHDCCTIDMELLSANCADKALQLWENATSKPDPKSFIQCLSTTIICLESLTDYYRLANRVMEEYRSLSVRLQLLSPDKYPTQYLQTQSNRMDLFSRLNQPHLALPVISVVEKWLDTEKDNPKSCQTSTHFVAYLLAKAEIMLLTGKVTECCAAVHQAMAIRSKYFNVRSLDAKATCSRIYHVASRIVRLPLSYHNNIHEDCYLAWNELGSALELVNVGSKLISSVVRSLMADWLVSPKAVIGKVPPNTVRKWALLDELLTSLLYTGATYVEFGEPVEANLHLQQGLKLAQAFHLPRRFADFHLELCNLNNLSSKCPDSQSHINISSYVLNTTADPQTNSGNTSTPQKRKLKEQRVTEDDDNEIDGMVIKTRLIEMPDVLESDVKPNTIGSPANKKWQPSVPLSWLHGEHCDCQRCSDVTAQGLLMKQTLQQALCFYKQGLNYQAEASWEMLLEHFDAITSRVQRAFNTVLNSGANNGVGDVNRNKLQAKRTCKSAKGGKKGPFEVFEDGPQEKLKLFPVMYQRILVEVSLYLTELSVCQQKWEFYEQWIEKVQDLLNTDRYPWMLEQHSSKAKMYYLQMVPAIPWPEVVEKTDLEELCERIGGVKLPRQNSKSEDLDVGINELSNDRNTPLANERTSSEKITPTLQEQPKLSKSSSQTDVADKKPLRGKLTAKATNSRSKCTSVKTDDYSSPLETNETAPLQRKKTAKKSSEDSTNALKPTYKTPARRPRSKLVHPSSDSCSPEVQAGVPEYMVMFKTPRSVSGRKAQLDILMNSDGDDDLLPPKSSVKKKPDKITALSARRTSRKKAESSTLGTSPKKIDLLSPSGANKMIQNKSMMINRESKVSDDKYMTGMAKSPMTRLFKSSLNRDVIMEMGNDENVYDFIPSSPEETPIKARGKKRPGKPGKKPAALKPKRTAKKVVAEEIEVFREQDSGKHHVPNSDGIQAPEGSSDKLYTVEEEGIVVCEPAQVVNISACEKEPPLKKNGTTRRTLTRSRTAKLETPRAEEYSSEDSYSMSFDVEQYVPQEDEGGDDGTSSQETRQDHHNNSDWEIPSLLTGASPEMEKFLPDVATAYSDLHSKHLLTVAEPIEVPRGDDKTETKLKPKRTSRKFPLKATKAAAAEVMREKPRLSRDTVNHGDSLQCVDTETTSLELVKMTRTLTLSPDLEAGLDRAFNLLRHQPTPVPYRQVCHAKILLELNKPTPNPWELAFYLTESHSVSFRHSALANIGKKLKTLTEGTDGEKTEAKSQNPHLDKMKETLSFGGSREGLQELVNSLEEDWTVIQVSVLTAVGESRGRLVVTRFRSQHDPVVLKLPGFSVAQGQKLLTDFSNLLKTNNSTMCLTNKAEWWAQRFSLDEKLKEMLENMESRWFGCWLGALQGRLDHEDDEAKLERASVNLSKYIQQKLLKTVDQQLVKLMLQCYHQLDEHRINQVLCQICGGELEEDMLAELLAKTNGISKTINLAVSTKYRPVILILDRVVQHIPWESMPSLRGQPVSRIPSLHFLCAHLQAQKENLESVYNTGVDTKKTFYVLNPDDNLEKTQSTFETRFHSQEGWDGIAGKPPTSSDFAKAITEYDQFIYCGHGSGSKFLSGSTLASLKCHAVVFLMGCSSGKLNVDGQHEASGVMLNYFLSGCPSIVGCLWDVTDRDIDRYLEELLRRWLQPDKRTSLLDSVHQSMDVCKLPYIIGSAPTVYGLPVYTKIK